MLNPDICKKCFSEQGLGCYEIDHYPAIPIENWGCALTRQWLTHPLFGTRKDMSIPDGCYHALEQAVWLGLQERKKFIQTS